MFKLIALQFRFFKNTIMPLLLLMAVTVVVATVFVAVVVAVVKQ